MRVVGEKSFPIHSSRSIVMIEHELRRLLQYVIILTHRESHEKNNESDKTWIMLLVTTMPFWKGSERSGQSQRLTLLEKILGSRLAVPGRCSTI